MFRIPLQDVRQRTAPVLLVDFRNFTCHAATSLRSENPDELLQCLHKPVRRLVENHRPRLTGQFFEACHTAFFHRQETFETEAVARISRTYKGRDKGSGSRQGFHFDTFLGTGPDKQETGIGNTGSPGIADKGDVLSGGVV